MKDVIVIGASAGGLPVLKEITRALPTSFPAAVIVATHQHSGSSLDGFLASTSALPIRTPCDIAGFARRGVSCAF